MIPYSKANFTARLQMALNRCLTIFLNAGVPGEKTSITPMDLARIIGDVTRSKHWPESLNRTIRKLRLIYDNAICSTSSSAPRCSKILVETYKIFEELIIEQGVNAQAKLVEIDKIVTPPIYGGDVPYIRPVFKLASYVEKYLQPWTCAVLLHGSLATLDYVKGYSDLDTIVVVTKEVLSDERKLNSFRKVYRKSLGYLYWFDPFQHHGHIIITEYDLDWYPECILPIAVFENARSLIDKKIRIKFLVRDPIKECRDKLRQVAFVFKHRAEQNWVPGNPWDAKMFLSTLMLLPAIYSQAVGYPCYKKNSFEIAKKTLPSAVWRVIDEATEFRQQWPYCRANNCFPEIAVHLGLNPQIIKILSINRSSKTLNQLLKKIDRTFVQAAARLAGNMLERVENTVSLDFNIYASKKSPTRKVNLQLTHLPYLRTKEEYQVALDRYVKQIKKIKAIRAIYQFGSIHAPGLSDIDLAVIVDKKISHHEISKLSIRNLCVDDQEIFLHEPTILTEQTSNALFEFYYIKNLVRIYGEEIYGGNGSLQIQDTQPNPYKRWALTLEMIPLYLAFIQKWLTQYNVDVRWAIPVLRSLKYLIELNRGSKVQFHVDWKDYIDSVNSLCENWFSFTDADSVKIIESVLQKGWKIVVDIAWTLDAQLQNTNQFASERQTHIPTNLAYSPNEQVKVTMAKPKNWRYIQDSKLYIPLPLSCLAMLDVYQTTGGILAKFLDDRLSLSRWSGLPANTEFELYLAERARLANKHITFLHQKNSAYGYLISSFVFRPKANPSIKISAITKRIAKKLINRKIR